MAGIELKELSLSFGEKMILNSISYVFNNGITVIRGDSGEGKTTLLNCIAGIYTTYSGTILIDPPDKTAYCLQEDLFFGNLTVNDNMHLRHTALRLPHRSENDDINGTLALFGIEDLSAELAKNLSGGEKQRLKMAMIMLSTPDIILLDEPTSSLDSANIQNTVDVIEKAWGEKLLVIVSHDELNFSIPVTTVTLSGGKLL